MTDDLSSSLSIMALLMETLERGRRRGREEEAEKAKAIRGVPRFKLNLTAQRVENRR